MSWGRRRFVLRLVRDGVALIFGRRFVPSPQFREYKGEMDGHRMAFGLYYKPDGTLEDFVCLWGTAEEFQKARTSDDFADPDPPYKMGDGTLPWAWWHVGTPGGKERGATT